MAKKSSGSPMAFIDKHHLIPSSIGGVVGFIASGLVMVGLLVFVAVWIGNMIGHSVHKHK